MPAYGCRVKAGMPICDQFCRCAAFQKCPLYVAGKYCRRNQQVEAKNSTLWRCARKFIVDSSGKFAVYRYIGGTKPPGGDRQASGATLIQLRDYQKKFITDIRDHFSQGSTAPLAQAPTGMGKTVCLSYMADGAGRKGNTVGITVHRQELVVQTCMALAGMGVWHNVIAPPAVVRNAVAHQIKTLGRSFVNLDAPTSICSIQTLGRRLDSIDPFDFLLIDECHHAVAGTWAKLIAAMPKAKILGVTATPERLDGRGLGAHCGGVFTSMINGPAVSELMERGFLARARVFAPPMQFDLEGIKSRGGDFDNKESANRLDKPTITGDAIGHYRRLCDRVPAIAFCASVKHAEHVAQEFAGAGYRAACVDGKTPDADRRKYIAALGEGRLDVLTSCDIISEGTDVPIAGAALLLRPTKSLSLHLQQVGRVLRAYEGKEYAIILDHVGNSDRHGLPDEAREWSLDGRKKRGKKAADDAAPVRQCPECYAVYPSSASVCPLCKSASVPSAREIQQREGELVEINKAAVARQRKIEQAQASTLAELTELGRRRGMKNPAAWAKYIYRARQQKAGAA